MDQPITSIILLSNKSWNQHLLDDFHPGTKIIRITNKNDLTPDLIESVSPNYIFVPHWSFYIPQYVWTSCPTIIFHMTDLPFGRGGSPLQNLIQRGFTNTKISALLCTNGVDEGDILYQLPLSLHGTADEIFIRANDIIAEMINYIIMHKPKPVPQQGTPVIFKRRSPSDSNINTTSIQNLQNLHDFIRMLDADGYPHAFLEFGNLRIEFRRSSIRSGFLMADVMISLKS